MAYDLGTVKGSVSIDIAQAVASYAALRRANAATDTALLESSRSLKAVGAGLVGIGAVAVAGFAVAVKAAADFQAQMRFFQVVTGSSKKDMQAATAEAFKLAQTSGYTANEIAGAFVELGKAGLNAQDIVAGVGDAVAQLGAAAQIPIKDAGEIIVNTMRTFQLAAGQATNIANQLAGAANASTVDITDLAYSLRYVGGTAASLGIPLHDVLDALGQLGNAGIRGSTGGTALRKILLQLAPTTKQAREELEKLGIIQTNGGVSADQYAKSQDKQKAAIDALRKAQEHLIEVQRIQQAQAADKGSSAQAASASRTAAAQRSLASAQDRLAASQLHLQEVERKNASTPLGATAASQASRFAALQAAQDRVAASEQHLTETRQRLNAVSSKGSQSSASELRAQYAIKTAQEQVAAAADKARAAGVKLAPGVEKLTNLFFDATGKAKPLSEIFQILQDHMKGLTQQQKVQAAELIFGNRAISSALILARGGAKGFADFGKQMDQTSAADVMRKRLDTLAGSLKLFKGALSVALIQAGAPAQKPLQLLVQMLTTMVKAFSSLPGPVQAAFSGLVLLFGAVTGGIGAFILLVSFAGRAVKAFREFKEALLFVKEIQLVQRAIALLNITMLANPVVLIALAIIALIAVLVVLIIKVKPVRQFFIDMAKDIVGAFESIVSFFTRIPHYFDVAWTAIKNGVSAVVGWIKDHWWLLPGIFFGPVAGIIAIFIHFHTQILNIVKTVINDVVKFFEKLPGRVGQAFSDAGAAVLSFFAQLPERVAYWLGFIIGRIIRWHIEFIQHIIKWGIEFVQGVISFFEQLPGRVASGLTALYNAVISTFQLVHRDGVKWVSALVKDVVNFFRRLPGQVWAFVKELWTLEVQGWKNIYHDTIHWVTTLFHDVVNFFKRLPGEVKSAIVAMYNAIVNIGATIVTQMSQIGSDAFTGIMTFFNNLPDAIYNALVNAIKSIGSLATRAFDEAKHWGGSLWNGFKKGLFGSPRTKIEYALEDMTATADRETKKLAAQVRYLNNLATRLPNGSLLSQSTGAHRAATPRTSGEAGSAGTVTKKYEVNVINPAAEKASESVPRVLSNLDFVGALG